MSIYIRCLNTLYSCGWAYGSTFIPLPPQRYPQIRESWGWNPRWCKCQNYPNTLSLNWGCRNFQTASHIHVIHSYMRCLNTLNSCGWGYCSTLTPLPPQRFPQWNPRWCQCGNDPTMLSLRLYNLSNCIPHPCHTYIRCLNTLYSCGWAYGSTLIPLPPQRYPQIRESWLKS